MFCVKCGTEIAGESKFCSNCGCPLQTASVKEMPDSNSRRDEGRIVGFIDRVGYLQILKIITICMTIGCFLPFCQVSICGYISNLYIANMEGGIIVLFLVIAGFVVAWMKNVNLRTKIKIHFWECCIIILFLVGLTGEAGEINHEGMEYLFGCYFCWGLMVAWFIVTYLSKKKVCTKK